ncbi:hypothetical protein V2J09_014637 [Rumex salicifolius]
MIPGSSSRVPLVRCPKCGHLLPELPPYSVYCCGGCGAYLRAEKGSSVDDVLSENSFDRTGEGFEREAPRDSKSVRSIHGDAVTKSPAGSHSSGRSVDEAVTKPPLTEIGLERHGKSPARSVRSVRGGVRKSPLVGDFDEQRSMGSDSLVDYEEMKAREKVGAWFDHVKEETGHSNRSVIHYEASVDESESNRSRVSPRTWSVDESPNDFCSIPRGVQIGQRDDEYVLDSSRRPMEVRREGWVPGGDHGVPRGRGMSVQDGYGGSGPRRFPVYPNEGPSYYDYDQPRHYQESYSGSSSLQNTEIKRAELFRLYNDLKEELSITGDHPENFVRRGHHRISSADRYGGHEDYAYDDEPLRLRRPAASVDLDERSGMGLRYVNRGRVPAPQSRFVPNELPFEDDPSWPQYPQRTRHPQTHFHPQRSSHEYTPGHSVDSSYEQSPSAAHVHRRYPNYQNNAVAAIPDPYDQHSSGSRFQYSSLHGLPSHSRSSVESKSDGGGSFKEHNKRVAVLNKNQLVCHPIDGASPFVICQSCSHLLRLPKKLNTLKKTQVRLQCGSCHTTLSFDLGNKKSHATTQLLPKLISSDVYDEPRKVSGTDHIKKLGSSTGSAGLANRESFDFDASGYTFPSTDSEPSMQLDDRRLNSFEAQKRPGLIPSSSNASKVDLDMENAVNKIDDSIPLKKRIPLRPPPGSSLQEHFDYSTLFSIKKSDDIEADGPGYDNGKVDTNSSYLNYMQITDGMADLEIKSKLTSQSLGEASSNDDISGYQKSEFSFAGRSGRRSGELSSRADALSTKDDVFVNGDDEISGNKKSELSFAGRSGRRSGELSSHADADVFVNGDDEISGNKKSELSFAGRSGRRSGELSSHADADVFVNGDDEISGNKKSELSFAGRSGRRSGELSPLPDALSTKDDVFVNGQHLAHREVKKAEKMAGPISPGRYWYDSRAGFWGIVGNCCLGIIPPFIKEFGSPMPVDCAGGNTGICVNGRELHKKDLEVLARRGLPGTTNKSYVIDISGKVEDEDTGDVVASLGWKGRGVDSECNPQKCRKIDNLQSSFITFRTFKLQVSSQEQASIELNLIMGEVEKSRKKASSFSDADAGAQFVLQSKGEWWHAGYHLTTAIVGPTILTLPYALSGMGWALGLLCLTTMAAVTFYSYSLLSLVLDHCEKQGRRHIRFRELAADILGHRWMFYFVLIIQTTINTGVGIGVILLSGQCLQIMYSSLYPDGSLKLYEFIAMVTAVLIVLSQLPSFHSLRHINFVSLLLSLAYSAFIVACCVYAGTSKNAPPRDYSLESSKSAGVLSAFTSISIIAAIFGNGILPEIQATLAPPTTGKMFKGLILCYSVIFVTFYSVAVTGYYVFGNKANSNILETLMPKQGYSLAPKWALCLTVLFVLLQLFAIGLVYSQVAFEIMEKKTSDVTQSMFSKRNLVPRLVARTSYMMMCGLFAALLPFFGDINSVVGAIGFIPLDFVLPMLLYNMALKPAKSSLTYWINVSIMVVFSGVGMMGAFSSVRRLILDANRFKIFSGEVVG